MERRAVMRALALLLALLVAPSVTLRAEAAPIRVVSLNMCLDQLVLALAGPDQILGLSRYARDARLSHAAAAAQAFPVLRGAEEILHLKPDVVLTSRYTPAATRGFLAARRLRTEEFDGATSLAATSAQIERVGRLLGREVEAGALNARLNAAALGLEGAAPQGLKVLVLARRGYVSGRSSLPGELLARAGATIAGNSGGRGGFAPLEAIIALRPDALMITGEDIGAPDQGSAMLEHPALTALFPPERRIYLPDHLTVCGGPGVIDAMERLAARLRHMRAR